MLLLDIIEEDVLAYGLFSSVGYGYWQLYGTYVLANPIVHAVLSSPTLHAFVTSPVGHYIASLAS